MPQHLTPSRRLCRARFAYWALGLGVAACALAVAVPAGCAGAGRTRPYQYAGLYPPTPQPPRVVALGTLRGTPPPTRAEVAASQVLFGTDPPPPLAITSPYGLAVQERALLICDTVLNTVFRWHADSNTLDEFPIATPPTAPFALDPLPDGELLLADQKGVHRIGSDGRIRVTYRPPDEPYRPAGVLAVGDAVWVTNTLGHRIEVFDLAGGTYRGALGQYGTGPGELALPRGLTRTPQGEICIVDMLNNRVQVWSPDGTWLRTLGQPGITDGSFGRPRDATVGPDGTIFVTDALSQRVHAFSAEGAPLLAFGEPGSGVGELRMPSGITITRFAPPAERPLPIDVRPRYYVLVAEPLLRSGVRVYAWLGAEAHELGVPVALPSGAALAWQPRSPEMSAINPHWDPQRCTTCHTSTAGQMAPIAPLEIDALCISCHDGVRAPADPHPIGRPVTSAGVHVPDEYPLPGNLIGCITCHDIQRHCDVSVQRPAVNAVLLRGFDPQRPLAYCTNCHQPEGGGRFSPHLQHDATGRVREDACLFCHTRRPPPSLDGKRRFEPYLRDNTSRLCLNCHVKHWDLSPEGHVDRPVSEETYQWMIVRELARATNGTRRELLELAARHERPPAWLPLGDGMVTCYTCHNPHYHGLFPENTELGALATNPADRAAGLRTDWIQICSECHHR